MSSGNHVANSSADMLSMQFIMRRKVEPGDQETMGFVDRAEKHQTLGELWRSERCHYIPPITTRGSVGT